MNPLGDRRQFLGLGFERLIKVDPKVGGGERFPLEMGVKGGRCGGVGDSPQGAEYTEGQNGPSCAMDHRKTV